MNRQDVATLCRRVGVEYTPKMEELARAAVSYEREVCARIAEKTPRYFEANAPTVQARIAAAIRSRGNQ